ncbi:MAG: Pyridine nucleotide-disulfide oxidoreductase; NADH dehydrogenase, partial [uncultured Thermomicrobiales bacterium]
MTRFVIIGADAAGMSAAAEARRTDRALEIVAFDRGDWASYSQCGLPYLVGGLVEAPERLVARTVEQFATQGIEVRLGHEVTAIDPARRMVRVRLVRGGSEVEEGYDRLLIATGASPVRPRLPGLDLDGIFHLDVMEDAIAMQRYIRAARPERAVIVGGGYIGLEMAENLVRLGLQVRLVQRGEQLFHSVDADMAAPLNDELARHGVDLSLQDTLLRACAGVGGRVAEVQVNGGDVRAELVVLATGARPSTGLAAAAGVKLGATGAIAVDDHLRTNLPDVYAAGDCAEHWQPLLARPYWVPLGTTANKQGRVAGRNAAGGDATFGGIVGTAITRVFGIE